MKLLTKKFFRGGKEKMNKYIEAILSHEGSYVININGGDFVNNSGMEVFNLTLNKCREIRNNELLIFDNSNAKPIRVLEDGMPVYNQDFGTSFYVEKDKIDRIEELDADKYRDVFEWNCDRIFNIYIDTGELISLGLLD